MNNLHKSNENGDGFLNADSAMFALNQHSLVSVADLKGNIIYVNDTFCEVSGYSKEELIGKKHNILNSGAKTKEYWKLMHEKVLSGKVWRDEVKNRAKDGRFYWVDTTIVPNFDDSKNVIGFTSVRTEISKQKEIIEELDSAKVEAEQASKAKEAFLANMSHEIRTPMNGVYASLQLLSQRKMTDDQEELIKNSLFSCECLLTIINDILDFSKINSGKMEIEEKDFSLRDTAKSVISDINTLANENNLKIKVSIPEKLWDYWKGDQVRVKQVMLNLVSNAVKFTEKGSVAIKISEIDKNKYSSGFCIKVKDTGIGMSKDTVDKLFDRFSQADISTTRKYGGTGLGMSITYSLVKMMRGEIIVDSEEGKGTEMTILLPLKKGNKEEISLKNENKLKCPNLEGKIILVVDDNAINRIIMKKAVSDSNANVIEAKNGQEAIDIALRCQPDIIMMDIQMPVMDGISALRALREQNFNSPVIAFTANVFENDVRSYKELGFNGCMSKPIDFNLLYKMLHNLI